MSFGSNKGAINTNVPIHEQRRRIADRKAMMEAKAQDHTDMLVARGIVPAEDPSDDDKAWAQRLLDGYRREHKPVLNGRKRTVEVAPRTVSSNVEKKLSVRTAHPITVAGKTFEPSELPPIRLAEKPISERRVLGGFGVPIREQDEATQEGLMEVVMEVLSDPADLVFVSGIIFQALEKAAFGKERNSVWGRALAKVCTKDLSSITRGLDGKTAATGRLIVHSSAIQ